MWARELQIALWAKYRFANICLPQILQRARNIRSKLHRIKPSSLGSGDHCVFHNSVTIVLYVLSVTGIVYGLRWIIRSLLVGIHWDRVFRITLPWWFQLICWQNGARSCTTEAWLDHSRLGITVNHMHDSIFYVSCYMKLSVLDVTHIRMGCGRRIIR